MSNKNVKIYFYLLFSQLHLFPFLNLLAMSLLHSPQLFLPAQEI